MKEISKLIEIFKKGKDLEIESTKDFINCLADKEQSEMNLALLTTAWKLKGISSEELALIANHILDNYIGRVILPIDKNEILLDCCGVGGDDSQSFNISTTTAFVLACCGIKIAKHGGRKTTSQSGSIDLLDALNIKTILSTNKEEIIKTLNEKKLLFIASPATQQILGKWKTVCQKLEFKGLTGLIGTLTNPININYQIIGVPKFEMGELMIEALKLLKRERACVVFGYPKLDEISICGNTHIWELNNNQILEYEINPEDYGLGIYRLDEIKGGDAEYNKKIFLDFLDNSAKEAIKNAVLFNSAFILNICKKAPSIKEAFTFLKFKLENNDFKKYFLENFKNMKN